MALLGVTSLSGCNSIPSFIASGTKTIFNNATAPTSWTKDTTPNQAMLRLVNSSTLSPGGSLTYSQVFQSNKSVGGNVTFFSAPIQSSTTPTTVSTNSSNAFPVATSFQPTTLTVGQMRTHNHKLAGSISNVSVPIFFPGPSASLSTFPTDYPLTSGATGGGQSHTHGTGTIPHSHTFSGSHLHIIQYYHTHTFNSTYQFDLTYVDVIIASKN